MSLTDLSFKLYTDSGLTVAFTGSYSLLFKTDLSDATQNLGPLYFGSTITNRVLKAVSNPGVDNIVLTPTVTLPAWQASHVYTLGQSVHPVTPNTYRYEVTTAGTSGASEPTWPTTLGATVTNGSVVFTLVSITHPITEIKLASTSGGLDTAVAGDPLILDTTVDSGVANALPVYIRRTNTITTVGNNAGTPEIGIYITNVQEEAV